MIGYCKNHITRRTFYKCTICNSYICYNCLQKYRIPIRNKRIGFCSEECLKKYKASQGPNKKASFKYLKKSLIATAIIILDIIYFHDKMLLDLITGVPKPLELGILFAAIVIAVVNFGSFYDLYFLGQKSTIPYNHIDTKKLIKLRDRFQYSEIRREQLDKIIKLLKDNPTYFIETEENNIDKVMAKIREFFEIFQLDTSIETVGITIFISLSNDGKIRIYFPQTMSQYFFVNLLSIMESLSASGYTHINEELHMLKTHNPKEDFLIGVNEKNENYLVSIVDGDCKPSKNKYFEYIKPNPKYDEIIKIQEAKITLEKLSKKKDKIMYKAYA